MVGPEGQTTDDDDDFPPRRPFGEPTAPAEREPAEDGERPAAPVEVDLARALRRR